MSNIGLYIHIPFCRKKCSYCDFISYHDQSEYIPPYLRAVGQELSNYRNTHFSSMYIGGGTPSILGGEGFRQLFRQIETNIDVSRLAESTVEANPESPTADVLDSFRDANVGRLSIGLQSMEDEVLVGLGRVHSSKQFLDGFHLARSKGFSNINIDLIFGVPGQTIEGWISTLEKVVSLQPEHLSLYPLKIETGTKFFVDGVVVEDDLQSDMYLRGSDFLKEQGFDHYEISNFCKPGLACRHNVNYWENGDYVGVGVAAASHSSGRRWKNISSVPEYIRRMDNREKVIEESSVLQDDEYLKEKLMLMLRLKEGVPEKLLAKWAYSEVEGFLRLGLAVVENENFKLTPKGWLISNQLFQHLV